MNTRSDLAQHLERAIETARLISTLQNWGALGRKYSRTPPVEPVEWGAVKRIVTATAPMLRAIAAQLNDLLNRSDEMLRPLADPLRTDFGAHRWLRGNREEAYSDWLAWILQNLDATSILRLFALHDLLRHPPFDAIDASRTIRPTVTRELCVPQGHPDHEGRLDVVVRFGPYAVVVVEAKVGDADAADTGKQHGYAKWLKCQRGKTHSILLATDGEEREQAGGFELIRWGELCIGLRQLVTELIGRNQIIVATMTLAFVGAVEQNLLGLSIAAVNDFQHSGLATFDPTIFFHLQRWVESEERR